MTPFPQPWLRGGEPATAKGQRKMATDRLRPWKTLLQEHVQHSSFRQLSAFRMSPLQVRRFNLAYSSCCYIDQGQIEPCIDTQFVSDTRAKGSAHVCEDKFGTCHVATLTGKKTLHPGLLGYERVPEKVPTCSHHHQKAQPSLSCQESLWMINSRGKNYQDRHCSRVFQSNALQVSL